MKLSVRWVCVVCAMLSGCGAGTTKPEDITAFYTRYDYLIGRSFAEAVSAFSSEPAQVEVPAQAYRSPVEHAAVYDVDASMDYTGFELSDERATELRANQAVAAGSIETPGLDVAANAGELERVNKTDACGLRVYVNDSGHIVDVDMLGDVYTIRFIDPVPSSCTKRLDEIIGYTPQE